MRVCVYTAIYGDYDALLQPVAQSVACDFICFTDQALPRRVGAWRVIRSHARRGLHPRVRARYFKIMSHRIFPRGRLAWRYAPFAARPAYDYLIWVDGCLEILSSDFVAEFIACIGAQGWAMFPHPDRDCVYAELYAAKDMVKCLGEPLVEQVAAYRREGFPAQYGLMASTLIARDPRHAALSAINEDWWYEIQRWSNRDQVSLPVVLWRHRRWFDPVNLYLWDNPWFERLEHHTDK